MLRSRQQRTLERIFTTPTPTDIRWAEVVSLMRALDVEIIERAGSRVRFSAGARQLVVHKPHPRAEFVQPAIRDIAEFLRGIGVTP